MSHLGGTQPVDPERYHSIDLQNPDDVPIHSPPTALPHQPMPEPASDALSVHSTAPLTQGYRFDGAPPMPEPSASPHVRMAEPSVPYIPRYPPTKQDSYADSNYSAGTSTAGAGPGGFVRLKDRYNEKPQRPGHPRNQSWDMLAGIGKDIDGTFTAILFFRGC
jgi:hypothetical protein